MKIWREIFMINKNEDMRNSTKEEIKDDMEKIYKDDYRKNCSTILDY